MDKKQAFIFFGASGSGKGTQAKLLEAYLQAHDTRKVAYIETGNRFRKFKDSEQYLGKKIYETIDTGGLLPVFLSVWNWTQGLFEDLEEDMHIILDGSPRRKREPVILESAFDYLEYDDVHIIYLRVEKEEILERLLARARHDDNEASLRKRLDWFDEFIVPMLEYYRTSDRYHFHEIDGMQTIEAIQQEVLERTKL